jgi:hypothetical protein
MDVGVQATGLTGGLPGLGLSPDHSDTQARRADQARAFYAGERLADAMTMLVDKVACSERTLSADDPLTQALKESLANMTWGRFTAPRRC